MIDRLLALGRRRDAQHALPRRDQARHRLRDRCSERIPRIVYCHTRGFERGPRVELPGNDQTGACLAGVEWEDGGCARGGRPIWSLTNMGDTGNGFLAAIAICQALYEREKTGRGQFCETAIVNAQMFNTSHAVARPDGSAIERPLLDAMQTGFSAGVRLYPTQDEWLCLSLVKDGHWHALARALDAARARPRRSLCDGAGARGQRRRRREAPRAPLRDADGSELRSRSSTPRASLRDLDRDADLELWRQSKSLEHQWVVKYPHRAVGEIGQVGLAFQFSGHPTRVQSAPMMVGAHTREILAELGYSEAEANALFEAGIVGDETVNPTLAKAGTKPVASPWEKK